MPKRNKISKDQLAELIAKLPKRRPALLGKSGPLPDATQFSQRELLMGVNEEMEHTTRPTIALIIALDHLQEDKRYYTKLRRVMSSTAKEIAATDSLLE